MTDFELREGEDYIALNQLLKATGSAEHGAMANQFISEGMVLLNGKVDFRKRAKIRKGDIISFNEQEIKVI